MRRVFELLGVSNLHMRIFSGCAYDVGNGFLSIDITLHDAILVNTNGGQDIQHILVTGVDTIENQADYNLLPGRPTLVPELGLLQVHNVTDILHDTMERTGCKSLVFIIIRDSNQQLGVSVVHGRTKVVAIVKGKLIRITCGRGVYTQENSPLVPRSCMIGPCGNLHRMCVNSSLPPSRSFLYFAWIAFWIALGTG